MLSRSWAGLQSTSWGAVRVTTGYNEATDEGCNRVEQSTRKLLPHSVTLKCNPAAKLGLFQENSGLA